MYRRTNSLPSWLNVDPLAGRADRRASSNTRDEWASLIAPPLRLLGGARLRRTSPLRRRRLRRPLGCHRTLDASGCLDGSAARTNRRESLAVLQTTLGPACSYIRIHR